MKKNFYIFFNFIGLYYVFFNINCLITYFIYKKYESLYNLFTFFDHDSKYTIDNIKNFLFTLNHSFSFGNREIFTIIYFYSLALFLFINFIFFIILLYRERIKKYIKVSYASLIIIIFSYYAPLTYLFLDSITNLDQFVVYDGIILYTKEDGITRTGIVYAGFNFLNEVIAVFFGWLIAEQLFDLEINLENNTSD